MNLSSSQIRNRRCVRFSSSHLYVFDQSVKIQSSLQIKTIVLLDESHSLVKGCCYRKIWKHLNANDNLREQIIGSSRPISISQIIDMAGYGIVTSGPVIAGKHINLCYHPHLQGATFGEGWMLGSCDLGIIRSVDG